MTEQLHRLIDGGAPQPVINERVASLIERAEGATKTVASNLDRVGTDHESRIRYLERKVFWALGAVGIISTGLLLIEKVWKK